MRTANLAVATVALLVAIALSLSPRVARSAPTTRATQSQRLVWQADWHHGLRGWYRSGPGQVVTSGGILHYLGSDGIQLYAPHRVTLSKYAIEVVARLLQAPQCCNQRFSITLRGYKCCDAGIGTYMCGGGLTAFIQVNSGNECNDTSTDTAWHTYRVEVSSNHATLKIDGAILQQSTDNNFLYLNRRGYQFNGSVGLYMFYVQADVKAFRIYALR